MKTKKVICWDLDETLGLFSGGDEPLVLRYGITELLERLKVDGYLHFVVTAGTASYAKRGLRNAGMLRYFEDVIGRSKSKKGLYDFGKNYRCVAEEIGFSDKEASQNMVVIGNSQDDQPADLDMLVFLHHDDIIRRDSVVTDAILKKLIAEGNGNFYGGFMALCGESKGKPKHYNDRIRYETINLGNGIKFDLEKWKHPVHDEKTSPVITNVQAKRYEKLAVTL